MSAVRALALSLLSTAVHAQPSDEADLALAYGDKEFVMIATGGRTAIAKAPSVASVITAEDIRAMGATDLNQVLETVPGVHVSVLGGANLPIVSIRGIHTQYNPEILMLLNGIPMTSGFAGDRGRVWGGFPLEHIARIEVIRGPGSALYGAEAVSGVINIITKSAAEIAGTEFGLRAGSFRSYDAWTQYGGQWGGLDAAVYLRVGRTDGYRGRIERDAQSYWDGIFATAASRAPGRLDTGYDAIDARLDLARGNWRLRAGYRGRDDLGVGSGIADALDPGGRARAGYLNADLTWHDTAFAKDWDVSAQLSYADLYERVNDLRLFPAGAFNGTFPDGMIGRPDHWERQGRLALSAFYTGLERHRLRFGAGYNLDDLYRVAEWKNFHFTPTGLACIDPACSVVDVSGDASQSFLQPHSRRSLYAYVQDEWNLAPDWNLTAGVRHDRYSDFGSTTNPRAALVWDTAYDLTTKLMYGRAFRAPSFVELYNVNNPSAWGDPDLKPETIDMLELAFAWQPRADLKTGLNLFRYQMDDVIRFVSQPSGLIQAANAGGQHGHGLELEFTWDAGANLRLAGNYAYQRGIDDASGQDAGLAPHHHTWLRADWRFLPGWSAGGQVNWVAGRERQPGDTRPRVADYATVDLTLRQDRPRSGWETAVSVRNLFDAGAREPSMAASAASLPDDLPLPGRSLYLELRYRPRS